MPGHVQKGVKLVCKTVLLQHSTEILGLHLAQPRPPLVRTIISALQGVQAYVPKYFAIAESTASRVLFNDLLT